jgi:hypothetical protein
VAKEKGFSLPNRIFPYLLSTHIRGSLYVLHGMQPGRLNNIQVDLGLSEILLYTPVIGLATFLVTAKTPPKSKKEKNTVNTSSGKTKNQTKLRKRRS